MWPRQRLADPHHHVSRSIVRSRDGTNANCRQARLDYILSCIKQPLGKPFAIRKRSEAFRAFWLIACLVHSNDEGAAIGVRECNDFRKELIASVIAHAVAFLNPPIRRCGLPFSGHKR
jgi:hypothetical protein